MLKGNRSMRRMLNPKNPTTKPPRSLSRNRLLGGRQTNLSSCGTNEIAGMRRDGAADLGKHCVTQQPPRRALCLFCLQTNARFARSLMKGKSPVSGVTATLLGYRRCAARSRHSPRFSLSAHEALPDCAPRSDRRRTRLSDFKTPAELVTYYKHRDQEFSSPPLRHSLLFCQPLVSQFKVGNSG